MHVIISVLRPEPDIARREGLWPLASTCTHTTTTLVRPLQTANSYFRSDYLFSEYEPNPLSHTTNNQLMTSPAYVPAQTQHTALPVVGSRITYDLCWLYSDTFYRTHIPYMHPRLVPPFTRSRSSRQHQLEWPSPLAYPLFVFSTPTPPLCSSHQPWAGALVLPPNTVSPAPRRARQILRNAPLNSFPSQLQRQPGGCSLV